jgi:hypothetical protein
LRVLTTYGSREYLKDIIVLPLMPSKESVNDSCSITIITSHIEGLQKKNTAQDSRVFSESGCGNHLNICQRVLPLKDILTNVGILISLLQKGRSHLSERLTLMEGLKPMALLISSEENLKGNMLLLLSLLIEKDWLLNRTTRLLNLSLSQLKKNLFLLCFILELRIHKKVHDVMIFLSIKNQCTML